MSSARQLTTTGSSSSHRTHPEVITVVAGSGSWKSLLSMRKPNGSLCEVMNACSGCWDTVISLGDPILADERFTLPEIGKPETLSLAMDQTGSEMIVQQGQGSEVAKWPANEADRKSFELAASFAARLRETPSTGGGSVMGLKASVSGASSLTVSDTGDSGKLSLEVDTLDDDLLTDAARVRDVCDGDYEVNLDYVNSPEIWEILRLELASGLPGKSWPLARKLSETECRVFTIQVRFAGPSKLRLDTKVSVRGWGPYITLQVVSAADQRLQQLLKLCRMLPRMWRQGTEGPHAAKISDVFVMKTAAKSPDIEAKLLSGKVNAGALLFEFMGKNVSRS